MCQVREQKQVKQGMRTGLCIVWTTMSGIDVVQKDAKRTANTIAGDALLMMLMRNGWSDGQCKGRTALREVGGFKRR